MAAEKEKQKDGLMILWESCRIFIARMTYYSLQMPKGLAYAGKSGNF